jgi:hypothetical protein
MYNVTLLHFRVTIVTMEKQKHIFCVCCWDTRHCKPYTNIDSLAIMLLMQIDITANVGTSSRKLSGAALKQNMLKGLL